MTTKTFRNYHHSQYKKKVFNGKPNLKRPREIWVQINKIMFCCRYLKSDK